MGSVIPLRRAWLRIAGGALAAALIAGGAWLQIDTRHHLNSARVQSRALANRVTQQRRELLDTQEQLRETQAALGATQAVADQLGGRLKDAQRYIDFQDGLIDDLNVCLQAALEAGRDATEGFFVATSAVLQAALPTCNRAADKLRSR